VNLGEVSNPRHFVGRAPEQVDAFIADVVEPIRRRYPAALEVDPGQVRV
jgi:adenylosuccinate lyase